MNYFNLEEYAQDKLLEYLLFYEKLTSIHILTPIEIKKYNEKKEIDKKSNKIKLLPIRDFALLDLYKR